MKRPIFYIILLSCIVVSIVLYFRLSFFLRAYARRNIDCLPGELIQELKNSFFLDFPEDVKNIKTAKSIPYAGNDGRTRTFIVKFEIDPNSWNSMFNSIQMKYKYEETLFFEQYDPKSDMRAHFFLTPRWFKKPIGEGQEITLVSKYGTLFVYIDNSVSKHYFVYMLGWYHDQKK